MEKKHLNKPKYLSPNEDHEARKAIWEGICNAAGFLAGGCKIYTSRTMREDTLVYQTHPVPDVPTWRLVEALSLLAVLLKADSVNTRKLNILGQTGPISFTEDKEIHFLWSQQTLTGQDSLLKGRPDLVITNSADSPSPKNVLRVIECKCKKSLGAQDIRAEFGKAHDLKVTSYTIWSFTAPTQKVVNGAQGLGINLETLSFDTPQRKTFIDMPESLLAHVANTLDVTKKENRYANILIKSGQVASRKLIPV